MSLKKELKQLDRKQLIQLVIAIDSMYQNVANELEIKSNQYISLKNDVEEYRESLRLIGDRAYETLEPTYNNVAYEECSCVTPDM